MSFTIKIVQDLGHHYKTASTNPYVITIRSLCQVLQGCMSC